jgi:hypothetical protein
MDENELEVKAMQSLKNKDSWIPVHPLSAWLITQPGDIIIYTKPEEYTPSNDKAVPRKRCVAQVLECSPEWKLLTITRKGGYEWSFNWDNDMNREEIAQIISGRGRRQFYLLLPTEEPKKTTTRKVTSIHTPEANDQPICDATPQYEVLRLDTSSDEEIGMTTRPVKKERKRTDVDSTVGKKCRKQS